MLPRNHYLKQIEQLDPLKDHLRISYVDACYEFPWDTTRSLEFALFRTFGVQKGTKLLVSTGEFTQRTQKRYDDTVLILSEVLENGYDSERGRAALRRMNQQHGRYTIPNDEFLYVLTTFIYEPIRWNERYGWRKLTQTEKLAAFHYWRQLAHFMNIKDVPEDYDELERFNREYEKSHFVYSDYNHQLAVVTRDLMLSWYLPKPLWRLGRPFVYAFIDDALLQAVGFPKAPALVRGLVNVGMKMRAAVLRLLPARRKPRLLTQMRTRTYPHGYQVEQLGPKS